MKGKMYVTWDHADECPAKHISVFDPQWPDRQEICQCGMPSWWELGATEEHVNEMWEKRVEAGEQDR
ncbi:hypothetical protein LCGC14_0674320 [marine sediment metagenome]|uniref:Uncharacterized protein n=1 Tax=marine sediment metagenome TaxID=412755 RepID=A0A0F9QQ75_9ZZZZ